MTQEDLEHVAKKPRLAERGEPDPEQPGRIKGLAQVKPEFVIPKEQSSVDPNEEFNDEDEGRSKPENDEKGGKKKKRGQNKNRKLLQGKEEVRLCDQIKFTADPKDCKFGENCRYEHDVEKYISSKPADVPGMCPVAQAIGVCPAGLKCRWLGSHFAEGRVIQDEAKHAEAIKTNYEINQTSAEVKNDLQRKRFDYSKSNKFIQYLDATINEPPVKQGDQKEEEETKQEETKENYASYVEPPFLPSEKKKLYYDRAKILSPLTTVGNLPFRRLMKTLSCDVTYSEMALSLPLIQGQKSEWALPKAHSSEVGGFAVQIAASKYWQATKAAEAVATYCPDISEINLNCGCPIDLLYRQGAGSALLDNPARLLRMLRGMNAVSNDIPVTVKIRTGTRDGHPTAKTLVKRVVDEGQAAAIILHGRSRAQRYAKLANWDYIHEVADLVKQERQASEEKAEDGNRIVKPWIIGNGDVYSYRDWYDAVEKHGVDSVMVARGALIRPWIFEEVDAQQYLDKSASERLEYIRQYANFGLEHWGSDDYGVNVTRRFLCEWLSFTHRYVPVGILEYMPPKINDRPPPFKGRNEMETLLASSDYKDWIKITEMFLGPASDGFEFTPKHKSNAY
uniref:tRNA-dihydrouridine(47) synthase [NAD(P)(+)] n=1 Tax=Blastobotrys adeninivorans TaxID=409370 RepID=A0A060T1M5_BLAAD